MARRFSSFTPSVAVVTGAASGIGELEVTRLRAAGVRVVGGDRNPAVASMLSADQGFIGVAGDVTDATYVQSLVDLAEARFGSVDLLFHSAGIMPAGRIADLSSDSILGVMSVNYAGTVHAIKAVLPGMQQRRRGRIIVLGSLTGYVPTAGFAGYSASKSAVNTLVETLAHEEAPNGVQVLLVAPNAVKTPLLRQATGGPKAIAALAHKEKSPLMITPEKVLDDIDRALYRGKSVVVPGGVAPYLLRRISPRATWVLSAILG